MIFHSERATRVEGSFLDSSTRRDATRSEWQCISTAK
jgi:hypothetical protein